MSNIETKLSEIVRLENEESSSVNVQKKTFKLLIKKRKLNFYWYSEQKKSFLRK